MRTVTGKGSLEDPVSGEDSLRVEQSNYFVQVLANLMATSGERTVEKSRMQNNATNTNSNRIYSSRKRLDSSTATILQKHPAREEPIKLRAVDYVERNDHAKRDGEVLVEAFNPIRSVKVMGVNLRVQYENNMRCDKPYSMCRSR